MGKIFCVGLNKTGTNSLAIALHLLEFKTRRAFPSNLRTTHPNLNHPDISAVALHEAVKLVPHADAFVQHPWAWLWQDFAVMYPNAKFILTVRPVDEWFQSMVDYFGESDTQMRKWIYGSGHPKGNETTYKKVYNSHNRAVKGYFEGSGRLLVMNVTQGDGWDKLCPFLDVDIPSKSFPDIKPRA